MPAPRRFGRSRFTLVLLILASLTVLTLDYRDSGPVQGVRSVFGTIFSPFEGIGNAIATPFENGWKGITSYDDLEDENEDLRRQLDELRGRDVTDVADAAELEELQRLTQRGEDFRQIEQVVAQVTDGYLSDFDSTFEIDRGSGDGVDVGMVVMTDAGLLGRVESVSGGSARVRTITDADYGGFSVRLVEGRDVGIARPGPDGTLLIDQGVQRDTTVETGDAVVTSGLDRSAYPPGIPVGTVLSRQYTDDRTEQEVTVEPSADIDGISYVIVLLCTDCS